MAGHRSTQDSATDGSPTDGSTVAGAIDELLGEFRQRDLPAGRPGGPGVRAGRRAARRAGLLTGSGRQVRMLVSTAEHDVDPDLVGRYLDLAVELGADRRRR